MGTKKPEPSGRWHHTHSLSMMRGPADICRELGITPEERAELNKLARLAWDHGLTALGYEDLRKMRDLIRDAMEGSK